MTRRAEFAPLPLFNPVQTHRAVFGINNASQKGRCSMFPSFDIFQLNERGQVMWRGFETSGTKANETIKKLMLTTPSDYLIFNQSSGEKVVVHPTLLECCVR